MKEIAEPLMDLKNGMDELHVNKTYTYILSAILTVGNFLNGAQVLYFIHTSLYLSILAWL